MERKTPYIEFCEGCIYWHERLICNKAGALKEVRLDCNMGWHVRANTYAIDKKSEAGWYWTKDFAANKDRWLAPISRVHPPGRTGPDDPDEYQCCLSGMTRDAKTMEIVRG
jgi:uncharacterized protein YfaQ (DUF2300 family)